ncbi:hypothetical protein BJX76DRAFT_321067 [Aspergillus varians]
MQRATAHITPFGHSTTDSGRFSLMIGLWILYASSSTVPIQNDFDPSAILIRIYQPYEGPWPGVRQIYRIGLL